MESTRSHRPIYATTCPVDLYDAAQLALEEPDPVGVQLG